MHIQPLSGHTAIVTGGSRGIGRAIAIALAQDGARVAVNFQQSQQMAEQAVEICRSFGVESMAFQADVRREDDVYQLVRMVTMYLGGPTILVNNAGVSLQKTVLDTTIMEWDDLMLTNLRAPFLCARAVIPKMVENQYGRIINITSMWGLTGGSCEVAYSASKGGIIAMTKALAKEVGSAGITVNAVAPGVIETDMISHLSAMEKSILASETPTGRLGTPEDIASVVKFLASPQTGFITGQVISSNGGLIT